MKPPLLYFGAKGRTAEQIVALMPAHHGYIEPYAGSLSVLLAKPPVALEVVNDLDHQVMTFWRVLRDRTDELMHLAALTPHSRAELEVAGERDLPDELEVARRVWVRLTQGRAGTLLEHTGWRHFTQPRESGGTSASFSVFMDAYRNRMPPAAARLLDVSLECRPALEVIADYGSTDLNLLYVDPPYLGSTRRNGRYVHEMRADAEHRELADYLHACSAMVMLSGYASDLYDRELYADWHRHEFRATTGNGALDRDRTEVIWSNRALAGEFLW